MYGDVCKHHSFNTSYGGFLSLTCPQTATLVIGLLTNHKHPSLHTVLGPLEVRGHTGFTALLKESKSNTLYVLILCFSK